MQNAKSENGLNGMLSRKISMSVEGFFANPLEKIPEIVYNKTNKIFEKVGTLHVRPFERQLPFFLRVR